MDTTHHSLQGGSSASTIPLQYIATASPNSHPDIELPYQPHPMPSQYQHHHQHHRHHHHSQQAQQRQQSQQQQQHKSIPPDDAHSFISYNPHRRPASVLDDMNHPVDKRARKLVLCFDGTGNKFRGDDSDSNILKIFRMLDRTANDQYHYYQPGIGTYVVSGDLSHTSTKARVKSWYMKAKDSAFGSSFDQHVVGGYRFLMRFYNPGDEIYIFGFSRGAYIARFLAEMLDYVGLLSHGNEEMVHFAWKSFSQWQCRRNDNSKDAPQKKKEMYAFMKAFRETFSRPVRRIQFLGLFDTVNSVPRFETAWMERSKFPYTARSSAKVIRHAVSIDERRAKFRQDLVYQSHGDSSKKHRDTRQVLHDVHEKYRAQRHTLQAAMTSAILPSANVKHIQPDEEKHRGRKNSRLSDVTESGDTKSDDIENPAPYRPHSRSVSRDSDADCVSEFSHGGISHESDDDDDVEQDLTEVWFSGDHADIGGGWDFIPGTKSASHVPLTWMVREAMRAGLTFDAGKVLAMGCSDVLENQWAPNLKEPHTSLAPPVVGSHSRNTSTADSDTVEPVHSAPMPPNIRINSQDESLLIPSPTVTPGNSTLVAPVGHDSGKSGKAANINVRPYTPRSQFHDMMHKAHVAPIHDSLEKGKGLSRMTVWSWNVMEYMPFRRMDLQADGSWKPIRWPLPCGEVRDVPDNVFVHGSVLRRMEEDNTYRPGNLIIGGGGRGCRFAPSHYGKGEWQCIAEEGDPIGELWIKKTQE
ncbi:short chain dehydrogenase reductase family [Ophiostoma piceae UAMH 11346]|uniref:Short chain dehydrogenase reductase family n=1 Tax=Ophiostoma piceae (strain UAMH 11346) TaxID=1262450 RepID=S3BMX6_OPHP1|nr:short chain dehydrogenase reductase family [Ophiostoma piceae UAMH 11346]